MKSIIRKLRHIILFAVLLGSDILIGFIGHYRGATADGISFWEYITTVTFDDLFPVFVVAIVVVLFVEYLFKRN